MIIDTPRPATLSPAHANTVARQAPRTAKTIAPRLTDQVWPGFTRAELRDHIIDQIG